MGYDWEQDISASSATLRRKEINALMKKTLSLLIAFAIASLSGCSKKNESVAPVPPVAADVAAPGSSVASHGGPMSSGSSGGAEKSKWTQSGNPIDTAQLDSAITKAKSAFESSKGSAAKRSALVDAYIARGNALTEARQYASALGDFRRAIKLDPSNVEAKKWVDEIVMIYNSLNREFPKEGEEPPPLPFKGT